ncbi:hypothetical protein [Maritimibacter sp. UBA3975]|uniref:hypothetical protein n=1 Tax=Maritimibacter sp. UBA3975 TaxID=1946833 RepID=UPI000C09FE4F|nr:hypothetical protein [Maritimibacter sp. UBA3975]MAM61200.1 hypothetical protein [Maritimibacter sp.]|tara:strand:- start:3845 stop:4345 length:501 start_codon:yes stop_codon:yes gene_type:complete
MSDISELQARIANALDRIGTGLDALAQPAPDTGGDPAEVAALRAQLEDERTANAQLEERVRTIREKQDSTVETLAGEVERLTRLLATQEETASRLARVNTELRSNNAALREAISAGVAEPHLVNKSMMAELDALRAAQSADRAELDAVLGELDAMIAAQQGGSDHA